MKRRYSFYILLVLAAVGVSIAIFIYLVWNKPHTNISEAAAIEISAITLYDSLARQNSGKKLSLINQVVTVTGSVKQVMTNQQGRQVILLKTGTDNGSVNCTMDNAVNGVKDGEMLTLKGMCMGYSGGDAFMDIAGDVYINRCIRLKNQVK